MIHLIIALALFPFLSVATKDQELHKHLFKDSEYNPLALPNDGRTDIGITLVVYGLRGVDTLGSTATVGCSLRLRWHDSRLFWNPEDYNGIETTRVPTDKEEDYRIWVPDLETYENAQTSLYDGLRKGLAQVSYGGEVYLSLHGTITLSVNMVLSDYPYDI